MNIYFACSSSEVERHKSTYLQIAHAINKAGHKISIDWLSKALKDKGENPEERVTILKEGIEAIKISDALIAEVSLPSSSVGYKIALAVSLKKLVLCLYSEEFGEKKPPQVIEANNSSYLYVKKYSNKNLEQIISTFLKSVTKKRSSKFNFIATPEINRYLDWLSNQGKTSKSEVLREKIMSLVISQDKEYQSSLLKD